METIGKYEVVRSMGTGVLGEIYEARGAVTGARCVLKICALEDAEVRAEFLAAAERSLELIHPSIASVLDCGTEAGKPYLAEEFLSGEGLDRRLERGAPIGMQASVSLLFQVAQALAAASERGLLHRELRPSCIRLLADGRAKVQGFGIAHLARTAAGHQAGSAESVGDMAYVSPEQIRGETLDARSDQFSFGVVAYELLSGRRPFGGEHSADLMVQVLSSEPISLVDRSPDCAPALSRLVMRCLEKDPARRFADTAQLVEAMAPLVDVVTSGARTVTRVLEPTELQEVAVSPEAKRSEARARIAQHLLRGELTQAEAGLRDAERHWGGTSAYVDLRQRLNELRDAERRTQVKSLLDSARRFLGDRDFDLAQRACVEALTFDPAEPEAHRLLAEIRKELEHERRQDEMEASRSIARAAVAELLASPDPPQRPFPGGVALDATADSAGAELEATRAGVVETEWSAEPSAFDRTTALPSAPSLPSPPSSPASTTGERTTVLPVSLSNITDAPTAAFAAAAAAAPPPVLPSVVAPAASRIETLLAAGKLDEARLALEELKANLRGDETVRREHARLSAALLDAYHAQRLLRPSGARPLPVTGSFESTGSRASVTAPRATPPAMPVPALAPGLTFTEPPPLPVVPTPQQTPAQAAPQGSKKSGGRALLWIGLGLAGLVVLGAVAGGLWYFTHRQSATAVPALAPLPVPPRPGRLTFPPNALPGLTVTVDGSAPNALGPGVALSLPAGEHVLSFAADGMQPQELRMQLAAGEARTQSTPILVPLPPPEPEVVAADPAAVAQAKAKKKKVVLAPAPAPPPVEPAPAPAPPPVVKVQRGDLVEAGPGVTPPKTIKMQGAKYPDRAKREKREATIGVLVLVDENGRVAETKIQEGDPFGVGFEPAALEAVRQATFEAATKDGVAVKMWKLVRVGFRLK
ncbi:MAG: TonB family protein [Acidobacteriota bacterium]